MDSLPRTVLTFLFLLKLSLSINKQRKQQHVANKMAKRHVQRVCAVVHGGLVDLGMPNADLDVNPATAFAMQSVIHLVRVVL